MKIGIDACGRLSLDLSSSQISNLLRKSIVLCEKDNNRYTEACKNDILSAPYFNVCLVPFSSIFTSVSFRCVRKFVCICVLHDLMITVDVLVFVASCMWHFLLDFTIHSLLQKHQSI